MQRLILAAIVAYLLLPEEFAPQLSSDPQQAKPISTGEAVGAAQDVLNDLGAFCERNAEACETGQAIISGAKQQVINGLGTGATHSPSSAAN